MLNSYKVSVIIQIFLTLSYLIIIKCSFIQESFLIALPDLPNSIDRDLVDLYFDQNKFCTSDDHSVEEILEIDEFSKRLILVRFSHEQSIDLKKFDQKILHFN